MEGTGSIPIGYLEVLLIAKMLKDLPLPTSWSEQ